METIVLVDKNMDEKHILSFGAGVNSTALLFWIVKEKKPLDEVIFANPMNEMPETYEHIEKIKVWCKKKGILFTEVRSHLFDGDLMGWYFDRKKIPVRIIRSCTDLFKIRPIYKYLKKKYGDIYFNVYLGISFEEKHRAKPYKKGNRTLLYPLVDARIDRDGCKNIIKEAGFEIPVKSGCYFCPYQNKAGWNMLLIKHPKLFDKAMEFEENCSAFPKFLLGRKWTLRQLKQAIKEQKSLATFLGMDEKEVELEKCMFCHY